jgi:hypothetical protein
LFQRKDILNYHEMRLFGMQNGRKLGKNMIKSVGQGFGLGGSNGAKGIPSYAGADPLHDPKTGVSQAGIYADNLEWGFQESYLGVLDSSCDGTPPLSTGDRPS